jgi:hypothetical membrane protein
MKKNRVLLRFGLITPLSFWATTLVAGFLHGSYNHLSHAVSDLGEIGSNSQQFMAAATLLLGVGSLLFSVGFYRASRWLHLSVIPAILSFAMALSFAWAAVFPAGHPLHGTLGPLPIFILFGSLIAFVLWRGRSGVSPIRWWSLLSSFLMLLFFIRFIPFIQQNYMGLAQRFLWLGWSVWVGALGWGLTRLLTQQRDL